ncbi:unnamed protein product [Phytomonas sp. Hart1]|nr:unnamed protein product [Phytomonas sp. Hart1]|eukprot:CCW71958.1 unnamed protein product [Phytomonas sp. isolate Hart1]
MPFVSRTSDRYALIRFCYNLYHEVFSIFCYFTHTKKISTLPPPLHLLLLLLPPKQSRGLNGTLDSLSFLTSVCSLKIYKQKV